ncbi:MAG: response regulator [Verrucomicrobiota bacterium]
MISSSDILQASILIVDDQDANVVLLERILRGAGYVSIETTSDPHAVCILHRKNRYALILLDLQMPGMDGFQVMEGLTAIEANGYLPVLVITAQPDHKLRALKAGAKDFISKPFDLAEVLLRVRNLIEVRLLHREAEARTEQAERQFIQAQKMEVIGHLAAGVAHDFNNILMVILGQNEMITAMLGADHPLLKKTEQIRHAAERAVGLTRQLLIFSRKETVQPVVLELNLVLKDLAEMLRRLIGENIELVIIPGKQIHRVKADSGHVGQVLMNLAVNARDAMPNGGKLTIATENATLDENYTRMHPGAIPGDYVILSVSDTGTGMTEEVKARLFEAFFTTKPKGTGTGLGLAICQTIVQQSGGHISVHSEWGKGTTFKVYFPHGKQTREVATRASLTGPPPRGMETLLFVEDDPFVRHLACEVLEAQGYSVLRAGNGQEGLHMVHGHKGSPIRLVVTDVIMPLMGGKVMVEWLKTIYPGLKILFTSGYTDHAIAQLDTQEPGVAFLPKPYTPADLARKVRAMLDNSQAPITSST